MKLIDSHCHLHYDYSPKTTEDLVREATQEGVEALITIGTDLATLDKVEMISNLFQNVFHTVGVHPHEAAALSDDDLTRIEKAATHPKCRAIGEIGLDYYYDHSPRDVQQIRLGQQLEIARRINLPVIIHSRDGEADLLPALKNHVSQLPADFIPGIIHCFTGTPEFGRTCLDLGFYLSFSGILTFKKAENIQTAARTFPLDRMLVETDSPYLAPMPFRGKKCEPFMVKFTAQKLAEIKNLPFEEIARVTTENAKRIFKLILSH